MSEAPTHAQAHRFTQAERRRARREEERWRASRNLGIETNEGHDRRRWQWQRRCERHLPSPVGHVSFGGHLNNHFAG